MYTPVDSMIHEVEGYTGRLVEPEKIHELDLRAIHETMIEEVEKAYEKEVDLGVDNDDLRNEMADLQSRLYVALDVLRSLVEIDRTEKGKKALLGFQKISHEARGVLEENWA